MSEGRQPDGLSAGPPKDIDLQLWARQLQRCGLPFTPPSEVRGAEKKPQSKSRRRKKKRDSGGGSSGHNSRRSHGAGHKSSVDVHRRRVPHGGGQHSASTRDHHRPHTHKLSHNTLQTCPGGTTHYVDLFRYGSGAAQLRPSEEGRRRAEKAMLVRELVASTSSTTNIMQQRTEKMICWSAKQKEWAFGVFLVGEALKRDHACERADNSAVGGGREDGAGERYGGAGGLGATSTCRMFDDGGGGDGGACANDVGSVVRSECDGKLAAKPPPPLPPRIWRYILSFLNPIELDWH